MSGLTLTTTANFVSVHASSPIIVVSYDGAAEPTALWDALKTLGWTIPTRPPLKASAIDWTTPNPETGEDFTITSWPVADFKVTSEGAPDAASPAFARQTIRTVRDLGFNLEVDPTFEAKLESHDASSPSSDDPVAGAGSFVWPQLIALGGESSGLNPGSLGYRSVSAATVSRPNGLIWSEAGAIDDSRLAFARAATRAWTVQHHDPPPTVPLSKFPFALIVPDSRDDGGIVSRLKSVSSEELAVALLQPVETSQTAKLGLIIMTSVAREHHEKLSQALMKNYPQIIVRGLTFSV